MNFNKIGYSEIYAIVIFFLGMPLIGVIIASGKVLIGLILIAFQIPWFIAFVNKKAN